MERATIAAKLGHRTPVRRHLLRAVVAAALSATVLSVMQIVFPFYEQYAWFMARDVIAPPPNCALVFLGDSNIRFWDSLESDFPEMPVLNRGFGGARVHEVTEHFDLLAVRHHPRAIVVHVGNNDLSQGIGADEVVNALLRLLHEKTVRLGSTPVYFIALNPAPDEPDLVHVLGQVNQRVSLIAEVREDLTFINIEPSMRAVVPMERLFIDGSHLSADGYRIWRDAVRAALGSGYPTTAPGCS